MLHLAAIAQLAGKENQNKASDTIFFPLQHRQAPKVMVLNVACMARKKVRDFHIAHIAGLALSGAVV